MNLEVPPAIAPHSPFLNTAATAPSLSLNFKPEGLVPIFFVGRNLLFKSNLKNGDSEKDFADSYMAKFKPM